MRPFCCPQCGYKNYVTTEDLEAERKQATEAMARLLDTRSRWKRLLDSLKGKR